MFKLVAIGGKNRGDEYNLQEGENLIGRSADCDVQINLEGISKKHLKISVNQNNAFLEDLGSSNGTFINGKMVRKKSLKTEDKIALPNTILQLVYTSGLDLKGVNESEEEERFGIPPNAPQSLIAKIPYFFRYKFMPLFYNFNKEYEWRSLFGVILSLYILAIIFLTISPVLRDNRRILVWEMAKRGAHYAEDIARLNARFLERRDLDRLNTSFLDREDGVEGYELFDLEGRIVRPIQKMNEHIQNTFSISARTYFLTKGSDSTKTLTQFLDDGEIGIAKAIKAYNVKLGFEEVVGIITIRFAPRSLALEAANNSKAYLESLTTSLLVTILLFGILYFLTIRPIDEMNWQIERVLQGKKKELESVLQMKEINPLRNSVNSLLQKIRELQKEDDSNFDEIESDSTYIDILKSFIEGSAGPTLVLNSEKEIKFLNAEGEDLLGIRESTAQDTSPLDTLREQGLAATIIDLCDRTANSKGVCERDQYEISGRNYEICATALFGKDSFAKAFYLTFLKEFN